MGRRYSRVLRVDWEVALAGATGSYFLRYLQAGVRRTADALGAFRPTERLPAGVLALGATELLTGAIGLVLLLCQAIPCARRLTRRLAGVCALAWALSWAAWLYWWVGTRTPGLPLFATWAEFGRFLLRSTLAGSLFWAGYRLLSRGLSVADVTLPIALVGLDELRLRLPVLMAAAYRGTWGPDTADLLTVVLRATGGAALSAFAVLRWTASSPGYGAAAVAAASYALADLTLLYVNHVAGLPLGRDLLVSLPFVTFSLLVAARAAREARARDRRKTSPPGRIASGRGRSGAARDQGIEEATGPDRVPGKPGPDRQVDRGPAPGRVLGGSPLREHGARVLAPGSRSLDSPARRSPPHPPPRRPGAVRPAAGPGLGCIPGR